MARGREGRSRLGEINRAVNLAIRSVGDAQQYGSADWWAGPIELFQRKAGDCEDYAIAKYVALRRAGVPLENVRLVFVRDLKRQLDHAIVTVLLDSQWLILDNRTLIMVEAREALNYAPLVVMDERGVRQFVNIECDTAGVECFG
jgi:predicted transglutaminase-like cysteine proteinase